MVYFLATGNTHKAAGCIAEAAGGNLFELMPVEPYSDEDLTELAGTGDWQEGMRFSFGVSEKMVTA